MPAHNHPAHAVTATDLALTGSEGPIFGPLSFTIPSTGLSILTGNSDLSSGDTPRGDTQSDVDKHLASPRPLDSSARTALALTLAGRMRGTTGALSVFDETRPAAIRRMVALAGVQQIDTLDRNLSIQAIVSEHRNWSRPWWKPPARATGAYYDELCGELFADRPLPPLTHRVSQTAALDRMLLRLCLALRPAHGHEVRMLVLDDLEQVREAADRAWLLRTLTTLATRLPVVVTAVNPNRSVSPNQTEAKEQD